MRERERKKTEKKLQTDNYPRTKVIVKRKLRVTLPWQTNGKWINAFLSQLHSHSLCIIKGKRSTRDAHSRDSARHFSCSIEQWTSASSISRLNNFRVCCKLSAMEYCSCNPFCRFILGFLLWTPPAFTERAFNTAQW